METNPIEKDMREELVSEVLSIFIVRLIYFHGCWKIEEYTHLPVLVKLKSKQKTIPWKGGTLHSLTSLTRQTKEWYNIFKRTVYLEPQWTSVILRRPEGVKTSNLQVAYKWVPGVYVYKYKYIYMYIYVYKYIWLSTYVWGIIAAAESMGAPITILRELSVGRKW